MIEKQVIEAYEMIELDNSISYLFITIGVHYLWEVSNYHTMSVMFCVEVFLKMPHQILHFFKENNSENIQHLDKNV